MISVSEGSTHRLSARLERKGWSLRLRSGVSERRALRIQRLYVSIDATHSLFCSRWLLASWLPGFLASWLLASGFWLLASGFWLLASGFWLLASGFWLPGSCGTIRLPKDENDDEDEDD